MKYKTVVITPASAEPVTLSEAKEQLRIDDGFTLDDNYINALITAARDRVESYCNRYFTVQLVQIVYEGGFPAREIRLPYTDLTAVDQITYTDVDGVSDSVASGDYTADLIGQRVVGEWPSGVANYSVFVDTAPPAELSGVKQAVLMIVTDLYELRAETVVAASVAENPAVKALLAPYRNNLGV